MIKILSIETSTTVCSVALHIDGRLAGQSSLYLEKSHSGQLGPQAEQLMKSAETIPEELSAIAVSGGPGSYTGLRIGSSLAKGMCYTLGIPLIAVDTLAAMARQLRPFVAGDDLLCPMLDARRMEVYTRLEHSDGKIMMDTRPLVLEDGAFSEVLENYTVCFFGNGSGKAKEVIRHSGARFIPGILTEAREVGELAWERYQQGKFEDMAYFEPYYLKEFQATKPKKKL